MKLETLFVIFAPGLGGNHLSNLLSLTQRFNKEVDLSLYDSIKTHAHFATVQNLQLESVASHIDTLTKVSTVLCGHLGEYLWLKQAGLAAKFENKKFLVVTIPDKNTLAHNRLSKLMPVVGINEYFYQEQRTLYSQEILEKMFEEHDFFNISTELIFSDYVDKLLTFIQDEFCTTIDVLQATRIHQAWIHQIKKQC